MHKSKLAGFIVDCCTDDLPAAAKFWGAALGMQVQSEPGEQASKYIRLIDRNNGLDIELQSVTHPSRVHLDIETDNIEAEVARLEALGAKRVEKVKSWWVMQAPTGHRFCVVRAEDSAPFRSNASVWP